MKDDAMFSAIKTEQATTAAGTADQRKPSRLRAGLTMVNCLRNTGGSNNVVLDGGGNIQVDTRLQLIL